MVDYTNPFDQFKKIIPPEKRDNVVPMSTSLGSLTVRPPRIKRLNTGLDKIAKQVFTPVETETKEIVELKSSEALSDLVTLAFKKQREILELKLDQTDENFGAIVRVQASVCEKILTTQTKVDENVLRARSDSRLGSILEKLEIARQQIQITLSAS